MKSIFVVLAVFLVLGANAVSMFEQDLTSEEIERYGFPGLGAIQCKACEEVMKMVRKEIGKESGKKEIINALDRACTIIPVKKFRSKCRDAVRDKGDHIADQIIKNVEGKIICKGLGFC